MTLGEAIQCSSETVLLGVHHLDIHISCGGFITDDSTSAESLSAAEAKLLTLAHEIRMRRIYLLDQQPKKNVA